MTRPRALVLAMVLAAGPAAAWAQAGLFSRETVHGVADIRLGHASGEPGWTEGGFGKTGLSRDLKLTVPRAALQWTPQFGFALAGHVTVQYQPDASPRLDLNEAFLQLRLPPAALGQATIKAGVFYPPVSLEHTGVAWSTPDMLSASAINSWIGEEVLVGGVEIGLRRQFGGHEISASAAVFGWDDTAGTLLAFRGWALHGLTAGADTRWPLPPLSTFMSYRQTRFTQPRMELDNRAGYYGRLEWSPPAPVTFSAVYYDNAGNRTAVDSNLQWAWETRFFDAGVRWEPDARTTILAQVMKGETLMGYREQGQIWVDVGYRAAYLLARRRLGADTVSGRVDWFDASDRTLQALDNNQEYGWALTAAWRHHLADHLDLILEAQHVESDRDARAYDGREADQSQTGVQAALRVSF